MLLAGGEGLTADNLLKTLPKVAVLVQGNWIVKSEILYPAGTFSATSGVPADLMCRARDYVVNMQIRIHICFYTVFLLYFSCYFSNKISMLSGKRFHL